MTSSTLKNIRLKLKTDTSNKWESSSASPLKGEILVFQEGSTIETVSRIKVGTGAENSTPANLPFFGPEVSSVGTGNAVTGVSFNPNTGKLEVTKSSTFSSSAHKHFVKTTPEGTISATFAGTEGTTGATSDTVTVASSAHTHSVTAKGTVSAPTFTGTAATITSSSYTPSGTVEGDDSCITSASISNLCMTFSSGNHNHTFKGEASTISASYTPQGTVSAPTFTGTAVTSATSTGTTSVANSTHTHKITPNGTISATFKGTSSTASTETPS